MPEESKSEVNLRPAAHEYIVSLAKCLAGQQADPDNDTAGFAVWSVVGDRNHQFKARADLEPDLWGEPGDQVVLVGTFVDGQYGREMEVVSVRPHVEAGSEGLRRWLMRHKGVGPKTAEAVVKHLGQHALDRLDHEPQLISTVPGLADDRINAVLQAVEEWKTNRKKAEVLRWAHQMGFGPAQSDAIWDAFEDKAIEVLRKQPWSLSKVPGFGFARADSLAQHLELPAATPARLRAAVRYSVKDAAESEGHVYLPKTAIFSGVKRMLNEIAQKTKYGQSKDWFDAALEKALQACVNASDLIAEDGRYYLPYLFHAEEQVRRWLRERTAGSGLVSWEKAAELAAGEAVQALVRGDQEQAVAVVVALSSRVAILTGPPGSGKTNTIRAILAALEQAPEAVGGEIKRRVLLAAPTGRAARRMTEVTGLEAVTIHTLLAFGPLPYGGFGPTVTADEPLSGAYLIVDESSMADLELFSQLLDAIPEGMCVLFVGDKDQLPPVEAGAPFHAMVEQGLVPVVTLETNHRQGAGSAIAKAAMLVNQGEVPESDPDNGVDIRIYPRPRFSLPKKQRDALIAELRLRMANDLLEAVSALLTTGNFKVDDIQVLTPLKRGACGTRDLNERLRDLLNGGGREEGCFKAGKREYWYGDRVMQLTNNKQKSAVNGETGVVVETNVKVKVVNRRGKETIKDGFKVRMDDRRVLEYHTGDAKELALGYAITVHKSQGSEYPAVVMVVGWDAYNLLQRQLVYTGMTRAAKHLTILTEAGALQRAVATTKGVERFQHLDVEERKAAA